MSKAPPSPATLTTPRFLDESQAMSCIHCGLCLASCPTYLETGNENDSPRGRIHLMRALQEDRLALEGDVVRHLDLCLGCRACEAACPSGVPYGHLLEQARDHVEAHHSRGWFSTRVRRCLIEGVFPHPERMELLVAPARWLLHPSILRWVPRLLREPMELLPRNPVASQLAVLSPALGPSRGKVGFITGCVMSVLFGRTHEASLRLLRRAGYEVHVPPSQGCCGALHAHGGSLEAARAAARETIARFENLDLEAIVINAAGCGSTLKEYASLLEGDPDWAEKARRFSRRVRDLTEVLADALEAIPAPVGTFPHRVTFHDACHLAHAQRITAPPRRLVKRIAGDRFVEMPESDLCCGSAGSYNLTEPAMAARLQERKVQNILKCGAEIVVTTNPGCLLQVEAGLRKAGASHVRILHIAEFLDEFGTA